MYLLCSILGLAGGVLCAVGDMLFDLKGKNNRKLGTSGNIDSKVCQMKNVNAVLATVTAVCGYVSVIAGFFVHTVLCIQPVIYKKIMETGNFKLADDILEAYYKIVLLPFIVGYGFMLVMTVCVIAGILTGIFDVPRWFVLLNPFVFLLVGVGLRRLKPQWFYDLPGIILPSLGMGMFGLIGIVHIL